MINAKGDNMHELPYINYMKNQKESSDVIILYQY